MSFHKSYIIHKEGCVSSVDRLDSIGRRIKGKTLKPGDNGKGYLFIYLYQEGKGKRYYIHRLVAKAFVPDYFKGAVVNHIDEDKTNNHYTNLEWVTQQYNAEYSRAKHYLITHPDGREEVIYNMRKFCRDNGLYHSNLINVALGKQTHHSGYKARYL